MERIYIKGFVDIKGGDVSLDVQSEYRGRWADGFKKLKWDAQAKKEVIWVSNDPPPPLRQSKSLKNALLGLIREFATWENLSSTVSHLNEQ